MTLKLSDYTNIIQYTKKFKKLYNKIRNIYKELRLNENFLIFLFYIGLDKAYKDYFLYYTQIHIAVNVLGNLAFSLKYATQRFIQIIINSSASRTKSILEMIISRSKVYMIINDAKTIISA